MSTGPVAEPTTTSFGVPLTGNTIVATAAVVTTCSSPANCTDSLTLTCSGSVCIAMPCGGGSFNPDGAYDSLWDNVKPMIAVSLHTEGRALLVVRRTQTSIGGSVRGGVSAQCHTTPWLFLPVVTCLTSCTLTHDDHVWLKD